MMFCSRSRTTCCLLIAALNLTTRLNNVRAIAPPHPELLEESHRHRSLHESLFPNISYASRPLPSGVWESARDYKRRLDPSDPVSEVCESCTFGTEVCRYLSASECQDVENAMLQQAGKTRQFVKSNGRAGFSVFTTYSTSTLSASPRQQPVPKSTTQIRTLVIMVLWKDQQDRKTWVDKHHINKLWNGKGTDANVIPTGSIASYTKTQSHGRVTLIADIYNWQLADNTETYYASKRSGLPQSGSKGPELVEAFNHVLNRMDKNNFNFNKYDSDNDGVIDHVQFLHSGYGAEMGGVDCNSNAKMEDRIWSHMMPDGRSNWESKSGKKLGSWSTSSVFSGLCGKEVAPLGVMMHEFYHTLGLPDLYDRDGSLSPGLGGLGAYDMISSPFGAKGDQRYPGSLSPWSKMDIGFVDAVEIKRNGTYTVRPSHLFPDYFIIKDGFKHDKEYLLIENRMNVGIDNNLWTNGILIYKIDATNAVSSNRGRGYPSMEGWPGNGMHYPVALLQADGEYDLEKGKNNGDIGDFFRTPNQKLEPGNGETVSTSQGIYPNTDGYAFGDIHSTSITIDNFRQTSDDGTYSFRVAFGYRPPCQNFRLMLTTDDSPDEISWTITQDGTSKVIEKGQGGGTTETCLPLGVCYTFTITDSYGDGMCCAFGEGSYNGFLDDKEIPGFKGGSAFKESESKKFCTKTALSSQTAPSPPPSKQANKSTKQPTPPPTVQLKKQPSKGPNAAPTKQPTKQPIKAASPPKPKQPVPVATNNPTKSPTKRPTPVPTPAPVAPQCDHDLEISVRTDNKPAETTWEVTTIGGVFLTGYIRPEDKANNPLLPDTTYSWSLCITGSHNLYFKIYDSGNDGIQHPGGFFVRIDGSEVSNTGILTGSQRIVELRIGTRRKLRQPPRGISEFQQQKMLLN